MPRLKRIEDHGFFSKMRCSVIWSLHILIEVLYTWPPRGARLERTGNKDNQHARNRDIPAGLVHSRSVPNDISRGVYSIQILWRGVIWEISVMHCLRIWRSAIDEWDDKARQTQYPICDKLKPSSIFLMLRRSRSVHFDKLVKNRKRNVILKQITFTHRSASTCIFFFFFFTSKDINHLNYSLGIWRR